LKVNLKLRNQKVNNMIILFLSVLIIIALINSTIFVVLMKNSLDTIIKPIASNELGTQFKKIFIFAIYIYGIAGGVETYRFYYLNETDLVLNRWALEIFHAIITSYTSMIENYIGILIFALIASAIIFRINE
jgi:hypothetical protein